MWNKILDYFGLRERKPRHIVAWFLVLIFGLFTYLYFEAMDYKIEFGTLLPWFSYEAWFWIFTVILILYDSFFMFFAIKFFGAKQKWPFMIVGAVAMIFASITLFVFPGMNVEGECLHAIETHKLFIYFATTIMVFVSIYYFIVIIPQIIKDRNFYNVIFVFAILVGLVGTIWSYIFEQDVYMRLFTTPHPYDVPQSFTGNRNTYAFILVVAMMAEAFLIVKNNWVLHWVLFFYFFFNILFTLSKTSIIMAFVFFSVFAIWRTSLILKKHPIRGLLFFALMTAGAGAFLIIALVPFEEGTFLSLPHTFLNYLVEDLPGLNGNSFDTRINCFNQAKEALSVSGITSFFGFGYMNWQSSLYAYFHGYVAMDVAFAVNLLQFGIPGLIFSVALWAYAFFYDVRLYKHRSKFAGVTLLTLSVLLARCFAEAGDFTFPNLTGTVYYFLFLCPMLTEIRVIKAEKAPLVEA